MRYDVGEWCTDSNWISRSYCIDTRKSIVVLLLLSVVASTSSLLRYHRYKLACSRLAIPFPLLPRRATNQNSLLAKKLR